jgi:hypothetical protein
MSSFILQMQDDSFTSQVNPCKIFCCGLAALADSLPDILPDEAHLVWSFSRDSLSASLPTRT